MSDSNGSTSHLFPDEISVDNEKIGEEQTPINDSTPGRKRRRQTSFPPVPFEEALELAFAIQNLASGQKVRRLRLFELLGRSPESSASRALITNSTRYGLTNGSYNADWLDITPEGRIASSEDGPERERLRVRFNLAIAKINPFKMLHEQFSNRRLPAKSIMGDFLQEQGVAQDEVAECVETFLLNARFVKILQSISGAERLLPIDHVLDYTPSENLQTPLFPQTLKQERITHQTHLTSNDSDATADITEPISGSGESWDRVCFYITPIGDENSEQRLHADLFLGSIVEPALEEFGLSVVRADRIASAGMINRQIIEHIMQARIVLADLSFHNPNVFYELALRHAVGLPVIQIIRASDYIPFDVGQVRTIKIDNSSIYTLLPQIEVYRAAIANQVRRALEDSESVDNPVTAVYPALKSQFQKPLMHV